MRKMLFAIALLVASILAPSAPHAQILILSSCGTVPGSVATLTPGNTGMMFIDANGNLCINRAIPAPTSQVRGTADSTDGAAHTIIASAGGSLKNFITDWECSNTSATSVTVTFNDSVSTKVIVPAGGGNNKSLQVPLVTAAATAFQFTSSTGASTITCNAQGYTGL